MYFDGGIDSSLIRIASYGRGVWETPLATSTQSIMEVNIPELLIYPNPATDKLRIRLPYSTTGQQEISIYSADGKLLTTRSIVLTAGIAEIDISSLSPGQYTLSHHEKGRLRSRGLFIKQ
jgi:hypothetical protein